MIAEKLLFYLRTTLEQPDAIYRLPLTPILGGFEAYTYRFQLTSVAPQWSRPLVLRLFQPYRNPHQAVQESLVQNALADQGYPAPRVYVTCTDKTVLGGAFLVMAFMPGETMFAAAGEAMPALLGQAHAALHALPAALLSEALAGRGLDGRLRGLTARVERFPWLDRSVDWLILNRPPEPATLAVCHGDFHPFNLLVENGAVSAVLDWPGAMVADPALDVAATYGLIELIGRDHMPDGVWEPFLSAYLAAYESVRPLDRTYFDYYRVLRCVQAFVDGAEGQEAWRTPPVQARLQALVRAVTGIGVEPAR